MELDAQVEDHARKRRRLILQGGQNRAVTAKGEGTAQLLGHLKKGEMATEAERLLKGSGWLPEVLRRADLVALEGADIAEGQGAETGSEDLESVSYADLPTFLTEDLPDAPPAMMAAE